MSERLSAEQVRILVEVVSNPQRAINALPPEERRKYDEAQQSVMEARRAGQRLARDLWID